MDLKHFRMLIHEFLNNDPDNVPEEGTLTILDSKSTVCMSKNVKDTNHTIHISRRVNFVRNGENCKTHKIDWYEGGLQLEDNTTKNDGENDLNPRIKISW